MQRRIEKLMSEWRLGHVLYKVAKELLRKFPGQEVYVAESGVTPSGKIHIGNFNDMVIAHAVKEVLEFLGYRSRAVLVFDSRDPFRKAPVFAPESFRKREQEFVGLPLNEVPDPWGCHENFAEHFINPFLESLEEYGISMDVYRAEEVHSLPEYRKLVKEVLRRREEVRELLNRVRERAGHRTLYPPNWIPYRPKCANCGRMDERVVPLSVSDDGRFVRYKCLHCGYEGEADVEKSEGKPPWRVDWPLRWVVFGVHFEPMGKDHMAAGSSYDTGKTLMREFFRREPPISLFYDFVYWIPPEDKERKTKLPFSGRKGIGLATDEWLRYAPAEVLKFLILRRQVADIYSESLKHIDFSPLDIPSYVDSYDSLEELFYELMEGRKKLEVAEFDRVVVTYVLSQRDWRSIRKRKPRRLRYEDAIEVALWMEDLEDGMRMLKRLKKLPPDATNEELEDFRARLRMISNWVRDYYSPELPPPEEALKGLSAGDKSILKELLLRALSLRDEELSMDVLRDIVREIADKHGVRTRDVYALLYRVVLGSDSGPPIVRLFKKEFSRKFLEDVLRRL